MEGVSRGAGAGAPDGGGEGLALSRYISSSQWDRVIPAALDLLASDPESAYLHRSLGLGQIFTGEHAKGRASLEKALSLSPEDDSCCWAMAVSYRAENKLKQAEEWARKALQLNPSSSATWNLMGWISYSLGDFEQALRCGEKALALEPGDGNGRNLIASARSHLPGHTEGNAQAQIADYEAVLELDPENDSAIANLGVVHFNETKDYARAEAYFRRALELDPADRGYEKLLIRTLRKRDPVLRLLWLPWVPVGWMLQLISWTWRKKWPLIFMIFFFKYAVLLGAAFAVVFGLFFWPIAKVYEVCTIADLHQRMGRLPRSSGVMRAFHRAPFRVRLATFLVILTAFYSLVALLLTHQAAAPWFLAALGTLIVVAVVAFYLLGWGSVILAALQKGEHRKRRRALEQVSLE